MRLRECRNLQEQIIVRTICCLISSKNHIKSLIHVFIILFFFECRMSGYVIILCVCVCVCVENGYTVVRLKGRVKAARDRTKDLLRAVNGTMETLAAIPNGKVQSAQSICAGNGCVCAWERTKVKMDQNLCAWGSDALVNPN